jgi:Mce-associated membrane protein
LAVDADPAGQLSATADHGNDDARAGAPGGHGDADVKPVVQQPVQTMRWALVLGVVVLIAAGSLFAWLGYRAYQARQAQDQSDLFLQVGRQAALNLTTISANEADADVARILDSATGTFHDDWAQRAPAFVEVVKKAGSKTEGSVTSAGLESEASDRARVLVAVSVKTSSAGATEENPRAWRMRIDVQKVGEGAKVANVEFVP